MYRNYCLGDSATAWLQTEETMAKPICNPDDSIVVCATGGIDDVAI